MTSVLVVDDDPGVLSVVGKKLHKRGYRVSKSGSGADAKEKLLRQAFDVVLCDILLQDLSGAELFDFSARLPGRPTFLLMTGYPPLARDASHTRPGVIVLPKPLDYDEFDARASRRSALAKPTFVYQPLDHERLKRQARSEETILITGETGVGKTRLARQIHDLSKRRQGPFIKRSAAELLVSLAGSELFGHVKGAFTDAVSDKLGAIELAEGGTLFIDEIGELDPQMQAFLLRYLDDRTFQRLGDTERRNSDTRLILATHRDLKAEVKAGRFREDLYYRLSVVTLQLPPLRSRPGAVLRLLDQMIQDVAAQEQRSPLCLSTDARRQLRDYAWPGNLREMNHVVRGLSATFDPRVTIGTRDLKLTAEVVVDCPVPLKPERIRPPVQGPDFTELFVEDPDLPEWADYWPGDMTRFLEVVEYRKILQALRRKEGNVAAVARELGYHRPTLIYRISVWAKHHGEFSHHL